MAKTVTTTTTNEFNDRDMLIKQVVTVEEVED